MRQFWVSKKKSESGVLRKVLLGSVVLFLFSSCNLFDKELEENVPIVEPTFLYSPDSLGVLTLVEVDTARWCEQIVLLLDTNNNKFLRQEIKGTTVSNARRGSFSVAQQEIKFFDAEMKRKGDTSWTTYPYRDSAIVLETDSQYALSRNIFGILDTTWYQKENGIEVPTCLFNKSLYEVSATEPCHQTIFRVDSNRFNHQEYAKVDGISTLRFEYRGTYSIQGGEFISSNVTKRVSTGTFFEDATYTPVLSNIGGTSMTIQSDQIFPTGDTTMSVLAKTNYSPVTCLTQELRTFFLDSISKPILEPRCTRSCHQHSNDGDSLTWTLQEVLDRVIPGDTANSGIYTAVSGRSMPQDAVENPTGDQNRYLNAQELEVFARWIMKLGGK